MSVMSIVKREPTKTTVNSETFTLTMDSAGSSKRKRASSQEASTQTGKKAREESELLQLTLPARTPEDEERYAFIRRPDTYEVCLWAHSAQDLCVDNRFCGRECRPPFL